MITKEFLAELETVRDLFQWKLVPDANWERELRSQPRLRIRANCEYGPEVVLAFDPIGAVCYIRTGRAYADDAWLEAATVIELFLIDAGDLIAAANDQTWIESGGRRNPRPDMERIRNRLAASVGLQV